MHQGLSRETQHASVGRSLRHPETCGDSFLCDFTLQSVPESGLWGHFQLWSNKGRENPWLEILSVFRNVSP